MSLFGSLKHFAKATGQERSPSVLGIDIGSSSIKIVELEDTKEGVVLNTYGEINLGPKEGKPIGEVAHLNSDALAKALTELNLVAGVGTKNSGISIPFASSLATIVSVPPLDDEKLSGLIPIEARKYIPVPVSDVFLDWQRIHLSTDDPNKTENKVLLFAIHKTAVSLYQELITKAELDATFYEMEIFSSLRSSIGESPQSIILVDIGAAYTKLYVAREGQILATRKLNTGGRELTAAIAQTFAIPFDKAEEYKKALSLSDSKEGKMLELVRSFYDNIFSEIGKLRELYERSSGGDMVKGLVYAGGASLVPGLLERSKEKTTLPGQMANPFESVKTPPFFEKLVGKTGPEFSVALGIALRKIHMRE